MTNQRPLIIFLLTAISLCAFIFFVMTQLVFTKPEEGEQPVKVIYKDWGTISSIDNCKSSKYSLRCEVITDKYTFNSLDITDFPNDYLKVGDHIQFKTVIYQKSYNTYHVRNNLQLIRGVCYSWMPCFSDYEQYVK